MEIRWNVLFLALGAIGLCLGLSFFLQDDQYLVGIAGGIVGAIAATMKELVNPSEPPPPPPPPSVPATTVDGILSTFEKLIPQQTQQRE